ncbi:MAG: hypothetical protein J6X50_04600, partial [Bacilli bacterium]|nr:hypothetical protein [Bacilli bacterium]
HITDADVKRSLPKNRKEVFFDLLKHRKMTLFALSCFTFMFFIPLAVDLLYFNFLESAAISADKYEYLFSLVFYSMAIMVPCMMIGFLGFAGAFYTAKKIVWQEGTMFASDFFQGIKENWGRAVLNGLLFGVILFGFVIGGSYLLIFQQASPILVGVGIGALTLFLLVFGMITVLNFTQDVYYSTPMMQTLKNSFCFVGLLNWRILLVFVFSTGVVITLSCFNMITLAIGLFLFSITNSVAIILYTLMSHYAFDKYINLEQYPDMVGKGLYKVEIDDKEA